MKKIAKIIAAMSVAVAAFALVGCADGMTKEIKAAYAPDAPAAPEAGTYYLNWSISNLDDYEDLMTYYDAGPANMTTISRVVTPIPAAEEGEDPTYRVTYAIGSDTYSIKQWKALYDLDIVDNTKSIDITSTGYTYTYKPLTDLKQTGTTHFDLKSKTTDILGCAVAAPKTTTVTSTDTAKWNAIPSSEKEATIAVTAATETTPAITRVSWTDFDGDVYDAVSQENIEGIVVFSVDGDEISFTTWDDNAPITNAEGATIGYSPAVYTYVFAKRAQ